MRTKLLKEPNALREVTGRIKSRERPTWTNQQVEAARLWGEHLPHSKIALKLGIKHENQISTMLKRFRPTAEAIHSAHSRLGPYWKRLGDLRAGERTKTWQKTTASRGGWPHRQALPGYQIVKVDGLRQMERNPATWEVMRAVFDHVLHQDVPLQVFKRHFQRLGLKNPVSLYQTVLNPGYQGLSHWRDLETQEEMTYQGKHPPMITDNEKGVLKQILSDEPVRMLAPWGLQREGRKILAPIDEIYASVLQNAWTQRLRRRSVTEISESTGIPLSVVRRMFLNRAYLDSGVIEVLAWQAAKKIRVEPRETRRKIREANEARILSSFNDSENKTPGELKQITGLSKSTVTKSVARLLRDHRITRVDGVYPAKYRLTQRVPRPSIPLEKLIAA